MIFIDKMSMSSPSEYAALLRHKLSLRNAHYALRRELAHELRACPPRLFTSLPTMLENTGIPQGITYLEVEHNHRLAHRRDIHRD
jgi:hypothetical protein